MTDIPDLATPCDCLLAVITQAFGGVSRRLIGAGSETSSDEKYAALIALAADFRVPVISIRADPSSASDAASSNSEAALLTAMLADPLADETIERAINDHRRSKLILAGHSSEGAVSFMALGALARGLDVYMVEDLCESASDRVYHVAMQRLAQAGAVLTTALQVQMEWSASNEQFALARQSVL